MAGQYDRSNSARQMLTGSQLVKDKLSLDPQHLALANLKVMQRPRQKFT